MNLEKTIIAVLILACLGFAAITWEESRADRASLEKALATQQQIIDAAETREQSRDANLKITLSQMVAVNRSVRTPQEIIGAMQQFLNLPKPIMQVTKSAIDQPNPVRGSRLSRIGDLSRNPAVATAPYSKQDSDHQQTSRSASSDATATQYCDPPPGATTQSLAATPNLKSEILDFFTRKSDPLANVAMLPFVDSTSIPDVASLRLNPDASVSVPTADLRPLFDKIQSCRSCESQLAVSQADLADEKTRSATLTKERDAALRSGKGRGFWHRLAQNAKWAAIGAAVAAGASRFR
jgi:hypothetical protein